MKNQTIYFTLLPLMGKFVDKRKVIVCPLIMMKTCLFIVLISFLFFYSNISFANNTSVRVNINQKLTYIELYKKPSLNAPIIKHYLPTENQLNGIYHPPNQPDWIKVGDSKTGLVGWINLKQRKRALEAYRRALDTTIKNLEKEPAETTGQALPDPKDIQQIIIYRQH